MGGGGDGGDGGLGGGGGMHKRRKVFVVIHGLRLLQRENVFIQFCLYK